jgi:hypothetical protein
MDWLTEAACKDSRNFAGYEDTLKSGEPLKAAAGAKKPAAKPVRPPRRAAAPVPLLGDADGSSLRSFAARAWRHRAGPGCAPFSANRKQEPSLMCLRLLRSLLLQAAKKAAFSFGKK